MDNRVVKVGLIGLGNMGQNHLRILSILKKVDLVFIYDADSKKSSALATQYGTTSVETIEDGLKNSVDAVIICTPTSTHAEFIRLAANHVKNIFVEKPMVATVEEGEEIVALVKSKNINLQVGFIERFNPAVQQLKNVLEKTNGVVNIDFTRTNKLSSRITDVDVISDLMIHDIDLALHINGPVNDISAQGVVDEQSGLIGFASAILTHMNGRFSRVLASRITEKKIRKIEATCDGIFVDCELVRKEIIVNRQSEISHQEGESYKVSAVQESIEVKPQEALLLEMQSFIESCLGEHHPINPRAEAGMDALKLSETIRRKVLRK